MSYLQKLILLPQSSEHLEDLLLKNTPKHSEMFIVQYIVLQRKCGRKYNKLEK